MLITYNLLVIYMGIRTFNSVVKVSVKGRKVDRFVKRLIGDGIDVISANYISQSEIIILIRYNDYVKIRKKKGIYKISLLSSYGLMGIRDMVRRNAFFLISVVIVIGVIFFLSNVIFGVRVIHYSKDIRDLLYRELDSYGIRKYGRIVSYEKLEEIEKRILSNNRDRLEWLEIKREGTKYIVKVQERVIKREKEEEGAKDIVASKNAVILDIRSAKGERVRDVNDYVSKGDVIISGAVVKPDGTMVITGSEGEVYGEVWYTAMVEYPYYYREEKLTGKCKDVYVISFLNKRVPLTFHKFKSFQSNERVIFKGLVIGLSKEREYEVKVTSRLYTDEEIEEAARAVLEERLLAQNGMIKEVLDMTVLAREELENGVKFKFFVSVKENIGVEREMNIEE